MMNLLMLLPVLMVDSQSATENSFRQELLLNSITGIITFLGILLAAFLAYRFAIIQKNKEIFIGLEKIKYERKLAAIEECWKLLAYTTFTENNNATVVWEVDKHSKSKKYLIRTENASRFLEKLADCFYGSGLGIYLSQEIKKLLFEYRGIIYSFLLRIKKRELAIIEMDNDKMRKRMMEIHSELVLQLKKETESISNKD